MPNTHPPLTGRSKEFGRLTAAYETAISGQGQFVLMTGEPGVGKSRLADELVTRANNDGVPVGWGRCVSGSSAPPLWPWIEAVEDLTRTDGHLDVDMTDVNWGYEGIPDEGHQTADRFLAIQKLTGALINAGRERPAILVLDDIHWADPGLMEILEYLLPRISTSRLLVVATARNVETDQRTRLSRIVSLVSRSSHMQVIEPSLLSINDTYSLIAQTPGLERSERLAELVHSRCGGNPLFTIQMLRSVSDSPLEPSRAVERIPDGISAVIQTRLEGIDGHPLVSLKFAAVLGQSFTFDDLVGSSGNMADVVLDDLSVLENAGFIVAGRTAARFNFVHALIRDVVLQEMDFSERTRINFLVFRFLREVDTKDHRQPFRLFTHALNGLQLVGHEMLVETAGQAGAAAAASFGNERAVQIYRDALSGLDGAALTDDIAWLHAQLSRAMSWAGERDQVAEADTHRLTAFNHFYHAGDHRQAIEVALLTSPWGSEGTLDIHQRALALVERPSENAFSLLVRMALQHKVEFTLEQMMDPLHQALGIARDLEDPILEARALGAISYAEFIKGDEVKGVDTAIAVLSTTGDPPDIGRFGHAVAHAAETIAMDAMQQGRFEVAYRHGKIMADVGAQLGERARLELGTGLSFHAAYGAGDLQAAEACIAETLARTPNIAHLPMATLQDILGHPREASEYRRMASIVREEMIAESSNWNNDEAVMWSGLFQFAAYRDDLPNEEDLDEFWRATCKIIPPDFTVQLPIDVRKPGAGLVPAARRLQCFITIRRRDRDQARKFYDQLVGQRPLNQSAVNYSLQYMDDVYFSFWHLLGMLAEAADLPSEARQLLSFSINASRSGGRKLHLVAGVRDYLRFSLTQPRSTSDVEILDLGREATSVAAKIGAARIRDELQRLTERIASATVSPRPSPAGLTEREVEVLALIAEGLSNPAIADRLIISVNTVIRHVSNIFSKTGCASRAEAAIWYERNIARTQASE